MSTITSKETDQLKKNISDQLDRLVRQLADLEECRNELSADEYAETKKDTMEQLQEFSSSLEKFSSGDMTLVDDLSAMKMAIQAAISEAFKTPEIIALFAKKQPTALRLRLQQLERDHQIRKVDEQVYVDLKMEILTALFKLKEELSPDERLFVQQHGPGAMSEMQLAASELGSTDRIMHMVGNALPPSS